MKDDNDERLMYTIFHCQKTEDGKAKACKHDYILAKHYDCSAFMYGIEKRVEIPRYAFDEAGKRYEVISIGGNLFDNAEFMESLFLPRSIASVEWSFWSCINLKEIQVDLGNVTYCDEKGVLYNKDKTCLVCYPQAYPAEEYHVLPSTLEIERYAFKMSKRLKTIYIPASVRSIGTNAFYGCAALEHVYIEGNLRSFKGISIDTYWEAFPDQAIFHYQGKEWSLDELKAEVAKSAESDKIR